MQHLPRGHIVYVRACFLAEQAKKSCIELETLFTMPKLYLICNGQTQRGYMAKNTPREYILSYEHYPKLIPSRRFKNMRHNDRNRICLTLLREFFAMRWQFFQSGLSIKSTTSRKVMRTLSSLILLVFFPCSKPNIFSLFEMKIC
jgi:hypothetical protein